MTPSTWQTPFHRNAYALPRVPYLVVITPMSVADAALPRMREKWRTIALAEQNWPYCLAGNNRAISGILEDSSSWPNVCCSTYIPAYIAKALRAKPHTE